MKLGRKLKYALRLDVRRLAILAMARLAWHELLPLLTERAAGEPDQRVRSELRDLAQQLHARGPRFQVGPC